MALKPVKKSSFPPLPEDVYCGVCYAVIDLGTQYSERYSKAYHGVLFMWEITDETVEIDGNPEPRIISKEYTLSWGDKSGLKKLSDLLFGTDAYNEDTFEAKYLLKTSCQLCISVEEKDDGTKYNKLTNIVKLAKGQTAHEPKELLYYEVGDDSTHGVWEKIPEWIRERIKKSLDFTNVADIPDVSDEKQKKTDTENNETAEKSKAVVPF